MSGDLGTFSIRIVDEDGNGVNGARIDLRWYTALLEPPVQDYEFTDSDGWATFDIQKIALEKVYVNDELVAEDLEPDDGDTFSLTAP